MVEVAVTTHAGLDAHVVVTREGGFSVDVSLRIPRGRTVALLGPNGAGKSTAVASLAGLLPLHGGSITLDGRTLDDADQDLFVPPEHRSIGVVFQDFLLFPHMSVARNICFGLRSRGMARHDAEVRAAEWLGRLQLDALADRRPGDLSGGQAQRVALARALATEPALLLLDEPLSALDATTRPQLRRILMDHLEEFPGPRVIITHDPSEAFLMADEIIVIEAGRVTQVGTQADIRLRPLTPYVADLAGSNLIAGIASKGTVTTGTHPIHVADTGAAGPVLATIHPRAIAVHRTRPEGSPRNTWKTEITRIEHYGDRVRLETGAPLPVTVEVTPGAVRALDLVEGSPVWVSIKATEIAVTAT